MSNENLQNEVEHLRAVCARQDALSHHLVEIAIEISRLRAAIEQMLAETGHRLRAELHRKEIEANYARKETELICEQLAKMRAIIEQMLAETGHGGNEKCGDNRLTPETVARAKGAI
jgi:hypothetical protein